MKQAFSASVWSEGSWIVAQCMEVDVASQGPTEQEALDCDENWTIADGLHCSGLHVR